MKKSLKMFCTSFTLSSFAIWVANEMFLSVSPISNQNIELPKQNIALFFQKQDNIPQALAVKQIASSGLPTLHQAAVVEENFDIADVMDLNVNDSPAIMISSVEDVADIPLEYAAPKTDRREETRVQSAEVEPPAKVSEETVQKTATAVPAEVVKKEENYQAANIDIDLQKESEEEPITIAQVETKPEINEAVVEAEDAGVIPLENGISDVAEAKIEIVNEAPQSQTAMADRNITVNTLAIEAESVEDAPKPREWHPMSESGEDSPWLVAQANQFAKNGKLAEDLGDKLDESEVNNLLYPEGKEDSENVVQTAEMVKNILIPIPEDIMNDENLTPQLVSPKKSFSENEEVEDEDGDKENSQKQVEPKAKKGLFKSLTSLFGGSSDDDEESENKEDSDDEDDDSGKKKGFLSSFGKSKNKTITKILPAEMRLSFQPGRAEISGQTLRWIQAFANKAAEDPDTVLEVRIDKNSSYALQQRRLELLHTILDARGIHEDKINTVFTSREPNSFIIRTLRLSENSSNRAYKNKPKNNASYQTW